jgi:hypothetical protein
MKKPKGKRKSQKAKEKAKRQKKEPKGKNSDRKELHKDTFSSYVSNTNTKRHPKEQRLRTQKGTAK